VAVSGGRDSMALLHCTARAAQALGIEVLALHVHHGLQPAADTWAELVERSCERWTLRFMMQRLAGKPARGESVEAWARRGRYLALGAMAREAGAGLVLLAHHRRDQAETFVLQALRGAGPAGLAAMPQHAEREGIVWARPWLNNDAAIDAMRRHRLRFVEDETTPTPLARSRLRSQVCRPAQAFPTRSALAAVPQCRGEACWPGGAADLATLATDRPGVTPWRAERHGGQCLRAWLRNRPWRAAEWSSACEPPYRSGPGPCDGATLRRCRGRLEAVAAPSVTQHRSEAGAARALDAGGRWRHRPAQAPWRARGGERFQRAPGTRRLGRSSSGRGFRPGNAMAVVSLAAACCSSRAWASTRWPPGRKPCAAGSAVWAASFGPLVPAA
jgi:tRNA(Ile)-lysidine synthase